MYLVLTNLTSSIFQRDEYRQYELYPVRPPVRAEGQDRQLQRRALPPAVLRVSGGPGRAWLPLSLRDTLWSGDWFLIIFGKLVLTCAQVEKEAAASKRKIAFLNLS